MTTPCLVSGPITINSSHSILHPALARCDVSRHSCVTERQGYPGFNVNTALSMIIAKIKFLVFVLIIPENVP